jgi:hypothetical protein
MYSKLNPSTPSGSSATSVEVRNISSIDRKIKLYPSLDGGSGLIYTKGKVGIPRTPRKKIAPQQKYVNQESSYGALGSDILFLISHNSQIPGKGKINFDPSKPDGSLRKLLNSERVNKLGFNPKTDLKEGLIKTYQDYIKAYAKF